MDSPQRVRDGLGASLSGPGGALESADRLCQACVDLLEVDGAAISLVLGDSTRGTFGSSNALSRRLDELQFTFGEGPCLDAVRGGAPVLVDDLEDPNEQRWPALSGAVVRSGIRGLWAFPVTVASSRVGALDLFRTRFGRPDDGAISGALWAAELAALPLLRIMTPAAEPAGAAGHGTGDVGSGDGLSNLDSLERIEVYQATGMIMAQLGVGPTEALVRLRAHAFAHDLTASDVAWEVIERRLSLEGDVASGDPGWSTS